MAFYSLLMKRPRFRMFFEPVQTDEADQLIRCWTQAVKFIKSASESVIKAK